MTLRRRRIGALSIGTIVVAALPPALATASLVVAAQPATKVPRVGYLNVNSRATAAPYVDALRQGLREMGYVEGRNILIEYRWADGHLDRLPALVADLLRLEVDVIVAPNTPAALAAKKATDTIPIVFVFAGDPVGSGLVSSLSRPGGNVTGLSLYPTSAIGGKQLELLKETLPAVDHVAVLANPANPPTAGLLTEAGLAARALGVRLSVVPVRTAEEFDGAFAKIAKSGASALSVIADPLVNQNRKRIVALAATHRLAAIYPYRSFVDAGGLMSYGVNLSASSRHSATYIARILRGASPVELPVEQPREFELVVNLGTAKMLGLTIPPLVLLRANDVIP